MATERNSTEMYFEWWLEEMKAHGLVESYEREPKTFVIADPIPIFYNQIRPIKPIVKSFEIMGALTYTPDYKVVFSKEMINKLIGVIDLEAKEICEYGFSENGSVYQNTMFYTSEVDEIKPVVYFDVKAPSIASQFSAKLGSTRDFKYVSRMMYDRYGIIVNKVIPVGAKTSLFCKTFMPKRYKFTDQSGGLRKLKDYEHKCKTLSQYLEIKNINL